MLICTLRIPLGAASQGASLARDPALTFPVLLQQALRQSPEYVALAARNEEAHAHVAAARSWLAGRPSLEASYVDDQPRSNTGMTELEYGIQLPLWRPGERRDAKKLGEMMGQQAEAWRKFLELTLAGRLRDVLAMLAAAEHLLEFERDATRHAQQIVTTVERLFSAGEAASLDVAQARTLLLAQRRQELAAEAALANAEANYARLTGLAARPATNHHEPPAERRAIPADHPWLRLLSVDVEVAKEQVKRARLEARGSPALAVGARRQRGGKSEDYNDSLRLGVSIPFGGSSHVAAHVSNAQRQKVDAEIVLQTAERDLAQRLDETRREQATVAQSLQLTEEQVALDRRQWEMAKSAFEVGEVTLFHVLTALRQSRASTREHELLKLRSESLNAQFNQIVAVLP